MNKDDFCVTQEYTIMDVMRILERNRERGVVVINEDGKACGFLSMGDIIYALVDGKDIHSQVGQICNSSFIYLKQKDYDKALEIFQERNLSMIPILDDDMKLTDVITSRELLKRFRKQ